MLATIVSNQRGDRVLHILLLFFKKYFKCYLFQKKIKKSKMSLSIFDRLSKVRGATKLYIMPLSSQELQSIKSQSPPVRKSSSGARSENSENRETRANSNARAPQLACSCRLCAAGGLPENFISGPRWMLRCEVALWVLGGLANVDQMTDFMMAHRAELQLDGDNLSLTRKQEWTYRKRQIGRLLCTVRHGPLFTRHADPEGKRNYQYSRAGRGSELSPLTENYKQNRDLLVKPIEKETSQDEAKERVEKEIVIHQILARCSAPHRPGAVRDEKVKILEKSPKIFDSITTRRDTSVNKSSGEKSTPTHPNSSDQCLTHRVGRVLHSMVFE